MKVDGFEWDDGNWPKCGRHGVSREEIEALFERVPQVYADPDHSLTEQRLRAIGRLASGRFLYVVFTFRRSGEEELLRPISARYMHPKEIKAYGSG